MSTVQLNPVGMTSTTEGYISSITVYTSGAPTVLTPDGTGKITVSNAALSNLTSGQRSPVGGTMTQVSA